jgi:hypothetical protein
MAQTKPKAGQFYGVSDNGTDGQFLKTDGTGGMSWDSPITNPTITSIDYPGSATAADPAGGESVIINGTLFASGITCTVGGTSAVTAFNSSTQITITTPAKAAGPYTVAVLNPNGGTASQANFIQYSGVPVWSTAAGTLGNVMEGTSASFQVTATEGSDTIEYAVTTGTLPTGLSLATATGAITGTAPAVSADTTTTFSITATDDENQTSASRSFSITVQNDAPSNHFNTVLYTGNGSTQAVTGLGFQPDLVWIKERTSTSGHFLSDSVRGATKVIYSNLTNSEDTETTTLTSFDTNGFSVGSSGGVNQSSQDYVAWNFKAGGTAVANTDGTLDTQVSVNNTLGFSIVSGSVPSSGYTNTLGHGLSSAPELIIYKTTNITGPWYIFSNYGGSLLGNNNVLRFDTSAATSDSLFDITSTTFKTGSTSSAHDYIAYCFASKPGFSKVGSYTGNGSTSGPIVQTDFEPAFLLVKGTGNVSGWLIHDNKRTPSNPRDNVLLPNRSDGDIITPNVNVDFFANGFQIKTTNSDQNGNNLNYIYLAIAADGSTATPSLANSFATEIYTGNGGTQAIITGFKPDFTWIKSRSSASWANFLQDSVRGVANFLISNSTGAQGTTVPSIVGSFDTNGFSVLGNGNSNNLNDTYVAWNWKAGGVPSINTDGTTTSIVSANQAAGFSIVQQTSNNSNDTIGHGLSAAPELIISKNLSISGPWGAYNASNGVNGYLYFNQTNAWTSAPNVYPIVNSTVFSGGSGGWNYGTGNVYINYCFTSIPGYSKVGTYTGNGNATGPIITTGFEPSFVMIKSTSITGAWMILDNKRSPSNPRQLLLQPQSSAVEQNVGNAINFNSNDFQLTDTNSSRNQNGATYIYLAIKEN